MGEILYPAALQAAGMSTHMWRPPNDIERHHLDDTKLCSISTDYDNILRVKLYPGLNHFS